MAGPMRWERGPLMVDCGTTVLPSAAATEEVTVLPTAAQIDGGGPRRRTCRRAGRVQPGELIEEAKHQKCSLPVRPGE